MNRSFSIFSAVLLITIASAGNAMAYVDPGSGSLILQMLIAGVVGALFYFRKAFHSLCSLFRRKDKDDPQNNSK
ncbi:MAG: hypothetical protein JJE30_15545 [Desulfuromonadales bacterium]|nr:hypothetical protein [Desulfuromonadales bacterium]